MCSSEELIGVFVRLPLSNAHVLTLLDAYTGDKETTNTKMQAVILAIGIPVQPCADVETVASVRDCVPLVRRTDMEAQVARVVAEKDAEIDRLRASDDADLTQVIRERDECEQVINDLYQVVMGEWPEWSNHFGYRDAVEDVVDYIHALRMKALKGGAA